MCTPLLIAADGGYTDIVEWLLHHGGANIEAQSIYGWTSLFLSCRKGYVEVVSSLLNRGADINRADNEGCSPLMMAVREGRVRIVEILLSRPDIAINARDSKNRTALFIASYWGREEVVRLLLGAGADFRPTGDDGSTPLSKAAELGRVGVVNILLCQEGIHHDARDGDGRTALWKASSRGKEEVVKLLLGTGVDPRLANNDGLTPLIVARERRYNGCIRLLEVSIKSLLSSSSSPLSSLLSVSYHHFNPSHTGRCC